MGDASFASAACARNEATTAGDYLIGVYTRRRENFLPFDDVSAYIRIELFRRACRGGRTPRCEFRGTA